MANQASAARVAGKGFRVFKHNGQRYFLTQPLRMMSHAEQVQVVLSLRRDSGAYAASLVTRTPSQMHNGIWTGMFAAWQQGIPSEEEWLAYNASSWQRAYIFWTALDPKHKMDPATEEPFELMTGVKFCYDIYTSLPDEQRTLLEAMISEVSQEDALKKSSGPSGLPETDQEPPMESQATEAL